jgi:hypothetical protein
MNSFTISGMDHVVRMLNQHPALLGLSSLAPIVEVGRKAQAAVARSKCGCSAPPIYAAHKHVFDAALNNMVNGSDQLIVKQVLGVNQICFYTTDLSGRKMLRCV